MYRLLQIAFFISFGLEIYSARILAVFPTPSVSHQVIFQPLVQELARRGHKVTVITPDPLFTKGTIPANLTEIDVHDISYKIWREDFVYSIQFGKKQGIFQQIEIGMDLIVQVILAQIKTSEVQRLINDPDTKFDLLLIEAWTRQALIYSHIFKVPVIQVSSFGMMLGNEDIVGAPSHPFLYPALMQQRLYNLTFWEKLDELYKNWWFNSHWFSKQDAEIGTFREILGSSLPDYSVLKNNVDMLFLNSHEIWMDNQPLPPNCISIWGIHKKQAKPLPRDLQNLLDSTKNGVIYLSFGTNAPSSTLPSEFIQLLIRVFSKLPFDVLWKWEKDELPGKSENIKISKWFPQADLLKHPNIKLFITQGGLQSTDEAIAAGVPLIGIPMLGDQWYNVEKYLHHNIGLKLDMETLNEDEFETAIKNVINNESYRQNIVKLQRLMNDRPRSSLDRAVWWTEYVLRHGGAKHLRARAANMPWNQYYEIEFLLTLSSIALLVLAVLLVAAYMLFRKIVPDNKVKVS